MISGAMLRDAIVSGANNIHNRRAAVDELNVFPVPDGDTGTNMSMTIGSALSELKALPDGCSVERVSSVAASSLLRGARGNSGVILSLLFRGLSKAMQGKQEMGSEELSQSLEKGVKAAYKAVMKPSEGTILTVARLSAEFAEKEWANYADPVDLFEAALEVAKDTLLKTPEMLPVLKKAGVVDSGGQGYVYILEGMLSVFRGNGIIEAADQEAENEGSAGKGVFTEGIDEGLTECYCTEFLVVKNKTASAAGLRVVLESIGDSVVCVDDEDIIKCHVHTKNPDKALKEALRHGYLSKIKIENMLEQYEALKAAGSGSEPPRAAKDSFQYTAPDEDQPIGIVAVCAGEGIKQLFRDLGATAIVSGGQTMNPSTDDILAAIQSVPAKSVLVLANNKNIIMASEQACSIADREALTVPTTSVMAGVSAMVAFDPDATAQENQAAMQKAAAAVTTGSVTYAARDAEFEGKKIKEGSILALENGKPVFTDTAIEKAVVKLAKRICRKGTSFLTVAYGSDVAASDAEALAETLRQKLSSDIDVTLVDGGQPVYYYYLSAE